MKKNKFLWLPLLLTFSMCQGGGEERSMNHMSDDIPKLERDAYAGNVEAYRDLRTMSLDYAPGTFLFSSLLMANKHGLPEAYLDVYYCIYNQCLAHGANSFYDVDPATQQVLLSYLKKAAKKGISEADTILLEIKKGPPPPVGNDM